MNAPARQRLSWRGQLLLSLVVFASVVVVLVATWGFADIVYLIIKAK